MPSSFFLLSFFFLSFFLLSSFSLFSSFFFLLSPNIQKTNPGQRERKTQLKIVAASLRPESCSAGRESTSTFNHFVARSRFPPPERLLLIPHTLSRKKPKKKKKHRCDEKPGHVSEVRFKLWGNLLKRCIVVGFTLKTIVRLNPRTPFGSTRHCARGSNLGLLVSALTLRKPKS
mgnify:CR=1 FL=1